MFQILISDETLKSKLLSWWKVIPGTNQTNKYHSFSYVCFLGGYATAGESYETSFSAYLATSPAKPLQYKVVYQLSLFFKGIYPFIGAYAYAYL